MNIERGIYWDCFCDVFNGCEKVSDACLNCWAVKNVWRFAQNPNRKLRARYGELVEKCMDDEGVYYDWTGDTCVDFEPLARLELVRKPRVVAFSWRGDWMYRADKESI